MPPFLAEQRVIVVGVGLISHHSSQQALERGENCLCHEREIHTRVVYLCLKDFQTSFG